MKRAGVLFILGALLGLNSCTFKEYKNNPEDTQFAPLTAENVDFIALNQQIFSSSHCIGCHGPSGPKIDLTNYDNVLKFVQKENPEASILYSDLASGRMPFNMAPLPTDLVQAVYAWIKKGAPYKNNEVPKPPNPEETLKPTYASIFQHIITPKCLSCHSPCDPGDRDCHHPDLDFTNYQTMTTDFLHPNMIVAGEPDSSDFYNSVKNDYMPMKLPPLANEEKQAIHDWILNGGKEKE